MSLEQRTSPRAAIRSWLRQIDSGSRVELIRTSIEQEAVPRRKTRPCNTASRNHKYSTKRTKDGVDQQERRERKKSSHGVHLADDEGCLPRWVSNPRPGDPGFAEHLGLHAPFRNFRACSDDLEPDTDTRRLSNKRKRRRRSTSSYLEPAHIDGFQLKVPCEFEPNSDMEAAEQDTGRHESDSASACTTAQPLVVSKPPRKILPEIYKRRRRHKTREDRYEFKGDTDSKRKKPAKQDESQRKERMTKKRKHREKSGAALMNSFTAQNVTHDRLTVNLPPL